MPQMMESEKVGSFAVDLGEWFESNAAEVEANLRLYFFGEGGEPFGGRHFETFAAMGDPNRFGATDVLAVEALSVRLRPNSAARLLVDKAEDFNVLLGKIPVGQDSWEVSRSVLADDSSAAELHAQLRKLDRVGSVTAGKLMAAKRPRLLPIVDSFVAEVLKPPGGRFWLPMYDQLADESRRKDIAAVCSCAPDHVTLLRRIDVAVWMHVWVRRRRATR